jgi:hypothetical protein
VLHRPVEVTLGGVPVNPTQGCPASSAPTAEQRRQEPNQDKQHKHCRQDAWAH